MKHKAVIFDMDGTLLDTLDDITDSVNHVIHGYGYSSKTKNDIRSFLGNGTVRLFEQCFPRKLNDRYFKRMVEQYKQHYLENCSNKTHPYPQVLEMLSRLRDSGIKSAIVSNKPDAMVKRLHSIFFDEYISVALGELPDTNSKPAPDLILSALDQLGVKTCDTLFVGDSEVDILTAQNAGMSCISATWGFRDANALRAADADILIDSPLELLKYI